MRVESQAGLRRRMVGMRLFLFARAIALLFVIDFLLISVLQRLLPLVSPWEFAAHYAMGAAAVLVATLIGKMMNLAWVECKKRGVRRRS